MTTEERQKILERVRKMMRLANNVGATEGERDNAMRMARSTLEKYNLDMASIEEKEHKAGEDREMKSAVFYGRPWARSVAHSAAELCFCSYLYVPAKRGGDTKHLFVGRTSNAITSAELAQYLVESINREAKRYQRGQMLGNDSYRAFAWGAASAIRRRVAELRKASQEPAKAAEAPQAGQSDTSSVDRSKALVVLEANEQRANQELITKTFGKLKNSGRSGQGFSDGGAMAAGRSYGDTVSLNRQVNGSQRARLSKE